jgi:hypothetical protein
VGLYLLKKTVLLQEAAGLNVLKELIMNLMEKKGCSIVSPEEG